MNLLANMLKFVGPRVVLMIGSYENLLRGDISYCNTACFTSQVGQICMVYGMSLQYVRAFSPLSAVRCPLSAVCCLLFDAARTKNVCYVCTPRWSRFKITSCFLLILRALSYSSTAACSILSIAYFILRGHRTQGLRGHRSTLRTLFRIKESKNDFRI